MSSTTQNVLSYLLNAFPNAISGQYIADQLHVSRNTVWKAMKELKNQGYPIEQFHKRGYALTHLPNTLNQAQLTYSLQAIWPELNIQLYDQVTSTNDLAKIHLGQHPNQPALIVATEQTKGRGRHGRQFHSSIEHGLYISLVIKPNTKVIQDIPLYTLLSASAMGQALSPFLNQPIQIKWVNDLFFNHRKVGGILCESIMDMESGQVNGIIIGIGLNLAGDFSQADSATQQVAGTLFGNSLPENFNYIQLLERFLQLFLQYHQQVDTRDYLTFYQQHLLGINQRIHYQQQQGSHYGTIKGINEYGHLIVETDNGDIQTLLGQEIHFDSKQFTNRT
ncbi:biotin--[acetyl-CoA-carboxylase] ligase [Aerococcaceae bacterium zg-ZUI334]|uniref:biotin--[acetyl-CoA-carboxylase] ligase n=1 Tax=Aerococcaceae bacterium zg-252 TaxID=2796928 RepID=UPI001B9EA9A9|nr:biotin--[acetyl-CoA-carboxylase] ligase [Aerococcaceae bacterium zg-ZUI334]